jgi:hypothetical protein
VKQAEGATLSYTGLNMRRVLSGGSKKLDLHLATQSQAGDLNWGSFQYTQKAKKKT